MILGIDEVGRGPWAGPLVVAAVVLGDASIDGLTDSKKLTKNQREVLNTQIIQKASAYGLGWVSAADIDKLGLSHALRKATITAVEQIKTAYHEIIIDGTVNFLQGTTKEQYVTTLAKADLVVPTVSAASIIAKVARDTYMAEQDDVYPGYGFSSHVGYGTAKHRQAIETLGVTPLHRLSFAPLQKFQRHEIVETHQGASSGFANNTSTTKRLGDQAEQVAVNFLEQNGHMIITRNWRTKFCEIDIISLYKGTYLFNEVKYRKTFHSGDGNATITGKKLRQMHFAADYYVAKNNVEGHLVQLAVVAVSGQPMSVDSYLQIE